MLPTNIINTAAADAPTPLTPEALTEQIRAFMSQIPGYVQLPVLTARAQRSAANLKPQFVESAFSAIDASTRLRDALGVSSAEELRGETEDANRWNALGDVLRELLKGIDEAVLTRRYRVGLKSLQAYSIARQLVRHPDESNLLPHLEAMKRNNRFGRKPKAAAPAPAPTPSHP
jgi:hypothetical protein